MIEIINTSRELNPIERYLMTQSPAIVSMKDVPESTEITVTAWCIFQDIDDETGEIKEINTILTDEKKAFSFQSKTFARSLYDMWGLINNPDANEPLYIIKRNGKSKAGRDYIDCEPNTSRYE